MPTAAASPATPASQDPFALIEAASAEVEAIVAAEQTHSGKMGVECALVSALGSAHGRRFDENVCATSAYFFGRLAVPFLDADMLEDDPCGPLLSPRDAAAITECLGLNVLVALASMPVAQA